MKKQIITLILLLFAFGVNAQERFLNKNAKEEEGQSTFSQSSKPKSQEKKKKAKEKREKPPISDYKIITIQNDTTFVDTSLTMQKDYKFNYLRRDDFELMPINNVGQTYNSLAKVEERPHLLPLFGARARHFNYMEAEDINYYNVPTPLTELYFKTTFEQGQQLDAFLTVNTSPRLNLSIAYKGNRSLGKYQHALTSTGNFRTTANYVTKSGRYELKTHFVAQDLLNEENGGLSEQGLNQYLALGEFKEDEEEFSDRPSIEVNFEDAESILKGKRFYLDHKFWIVRKKDSSNHSLALGHILDITDKFYEYTQTTANTLFGESYVTSNVKDNVALEDFTNYAHIEYENKHLGRFRILGGLSDYNYGYDSILTQIDEDGNETNITNRIKGEVMSGGASYHNRFKGFKIDAEAMNIFSGDSFTGNYLNANVGYKYKDYGVKLGVGTSAVAPNYNFLLYQSDYRGYNWQNDNFNNVKTQKLQLDVYASKFGSIEASYSNIDNYTYFTKDSDSLTTPRQYGSKINLLKVKANLGFKFWVFGLDNTIMYQSVDGADQETNGVGQVYNVPELTTRNSFYYQDQWFRKALFFQFGVTFRYFSEYKMDAYDPVLAEFYVQNEQEFASNSVIESVGGQRAEVNFGGFPQVDLFFNAKIRQTRIYFKMENFSEAFDQNKQFSAPGYAPRDAVLRFGLVWNFFL